MKKDYKNADSDLLCKAILSLKTVDECYDFFEDICTIKEFKDMAQRLLVAKMLHSKKIYSDIVKETGASTATISRVNRCLNFGSGGYELIINRLPEDDNGK